MKRFTMLGLLALTTGCVHYMPVAVSSAPLGPKEHPVAVVSGEASAYYFMGFGPMGDDSLEAAVADAKGQKDSDTIMNVFVDRRLFCFPLCGFSLITQGTTRIYGTLVKYDDPWTKEHVLPSIHIGNAAQSSSASSDIKTAQHELLLDDTQGLNSPKEEQAWMILSFMYSLSRYPYARRIMLRA